MNGTIDKIAGRREFLKKTGLLLTGATVICPSIGLARDQEKEEERQNEEMSPPEDLMREHGVLRRILLIYEEIRGRLDSDREFPHEVLSSAADIIHRFIEEYHERLEEDYLFPRFEKAGKFVELVKVLREQHNAGRLLTEYIKTSAAAASMNEAAKRRALAKKIHLFIRMYRPHASREDTIVFPAFRSIVSAREFHSLGEEFEDKETELFGKSGFEKFVGEVADLEKPLGIYELTEFTPPQ